MPPLDSRFEPRSPLLHHVLADIGDGKIQLPDFQRKWVWDDERIRKLIASVSLSYPIGAVMLLETKEHARFQPHIFAGVDRARENVRPDKLVLDGQQRLTSLYWATLGKDPVETRLEERKKETLLRVYYLDIVMCLDPNTDREDAVRSLPPERKLTSDFGRKVDLDVSTPDKEYEAGLLPLTLILDGPAYELWKAGFQEHFDYAKAKIKLLNEFNQKVWLPFQQYKVPVIELLEGTDKEAICRVFEQVNTGGVKLTVFELMTATFAAENFRLRPDWERRQSHKLKKHEVLKHFDETDHLTAVTLLASYRRLEAGGKKAVACKRGDILDLALAEYEPTANEIDEGLRRAALFLKSEKVFHHRDLPYRTQLIPLGAICAALGSLFDEHEVRRKLARWYWCGVFGELYGAANETRYANDLQDVLAWAKGGEEPRTVRDATLAPTRLLSMRTRNSAAYKGVMALLVKAGSCDLKNGDPIALTADYEREVDIHHLFPQAYCKRVGLPEEQWNSVVNKAPLTGETNRFLGGRAPSEYLAALREKRKITPENLEMMLRSHLLDPARLESDDFPGFIRDRAARLLDAIEAAMGKTVSGRDSEETMKAFGGSVLRVIPAPPVAVA